MTSLIVKIRDALIEAGIAPLKRLSQNFLINEAVLDRQLEYASVTNDDTVLEIGAGTGVLTEKLIAKAGKVIAIEYDKKLANYLRQTFEKEKNLTIIEADVLETELPFFNKVVANLPYHISSPITFKLLDYHFEIAILMYQYEFAERMVAEPSSNDYSRLSANLQLQANVEILEKVSRNNFYPKPRVDSAIVSIVPKKEPLPVNLDYFRVITRILFNTKNKLVSGIFYNYFKRYIPKNQRSKIRSKLDSRIECADSRVRDLSINDLINISQELEEIVEEEDLKKILFDEAHT
jgi:16S rRNA (adenine1518-N6/adenine1519-N6)-dimethyltransferase